MLAPEDIEIKPTAAEVPDERASVRPYGSFRIRYRKVDSVSLWGDGGSRLGLAGKRRLDAGIKIVGRAEVGVNTLDEVDLLFSRRDRPPGESFGDTVFLRLLYAGIEKPGVGLTAGKNWSTYYSVSSFTDQFQGTGASASGTYNARTDGGNTGTGRSDRALQMQVQFDRTDRRHHIKTFSLGLQLQHGEPIPTVPDINYETTAGVSAVLSTNDGLAAGVAYNHANIDTSDLAALHASGIDGDATALVIGVRWQRERWYLGAVASRLENHEITNRSVFFDGRGWEVYSHVRVRGPWWAVAGWNQLKPQEMEDQAGAFNVNYGVIGVRYTFDGFEKMIFANVRLESGAAQDGQVLDDVYTIGVRWDLP